MRPRQHSPRPGLESLEGRLALSTIAAAPAVAAEVRTPPAHAHAAAIQARTFTLDDLQAFSAAYLSTPRSPNYNPAYDFNHNGFIGHDDAKYLVLHERTLTPNIPLRSSIHLARGEQVAHPSVHNSGGITRWNTVTIVGRTTPGSILFTDNSNANFRFNALALPTDGKGDFSYTLNLKDKLTNTEYLIFDPFGHQKVASFPILRIDR
jgi:hypothetical protein